MSLNDTIRSGVATAKSILQTGQLLATVYLLKPATPVIRNEDGTPQRPTRKAYRALVSSAHKLTRTASGTEFTATTKVTFLEAVTVGAEDLVELPNGTVPAYQALGEGVRPASGGSYVVSVYCG